MDSSHQLEFNFERRNIRNVWRSGKLTDEQWKKLSLQWSKELKKYKIRTPKSFSFNKYQSFGNKTKYLIGQFNHDLTSGIKGYMEKGWGLANKKNNALASQYLKTFDLTTKEFPSFFNANVGAMNQFVNRSINGLNLAQNIWKQTDEAMDILETWVGTGIATGRSAKRIAGDVLECLKNPNMTLNVPRGTYRSPYANSLRMARTEVNMAYRQADHLRYQQLDFVVGIEVHLSGNHPKTDICDDMEGPYPKGFQFLGWHPACFCYQTSILAKKEDFLKSVRNDTVIPASRRVRNMPVNAQKYVKKNIDKFMRYKQPPYWLDNNRRYIAKALGTPVPGQVPYIEVQAEKLMKRAQTVGDEVYKVSKSYADQFGGTSTPINYKSKDSILRKARDELAGDVSLVKDSVRTTIIVENEQIDAVVAALEKDQRFVRVKHQTPDKFMGYNGVLTNIKTRTGLLGEIQVLSPEMIYAKMPPKDAIRLLGQERFDMIGKVTGKPPGLGHKFYEEYRVLNREIASQAKKMDVIWSESTEYYSHFQTRISLEVEEKVVQTAATEAVERDVWSKINDIEKEIRYQTFESAAVWDSSGEQILFKNGAERQVAFTDEEVLKFGNCIMTHNHPSGMKYAAEQFGSIGHSFSAQDIAFSVKHNLAEIRAVTQSYTFVMRRPAGGWPTLDEFKEAFSAAEDRVYANLRPRFNDKSSFFYEDRDGTISTLHCHLLWKYLSKTLNLPYFKSRY